MQLGEFLREFAVSDSCHIQSSNSTWGTVPQWIGGVATFLALGWAVFLYRRSLRERRADGPRRVYAVRFNKPFAFKAGFNLNWHLQVHSPNLTYSEVAVAESSALYGQGPDDLLAYPATQDGVALDFRVVNGSEEVITDIRVGVWNQAKSPDLRGIFLARGFLGPGESFLAQVRVGTSEGENPEELLPCIEFVDASGIRWSHKTGEPLREGRKLA